MIIINYIKRMMILNKKAFSLDGNQLKTLAVVFMIFDHIYSYLLLDILPNWCSLIARFVAPLFVFMLVEGFFHTHSRKDYLFRILEAATITWVGEIAINLAFHRVDPLTHKMTIYSLLQGNNISLYSSLTFDNEWMMISVIPFIWLYNGQRGKKSWLSKYFFYIIYPAHLWLLMIIKYLFLG